jgi:hypothetical protein
MFFLDGSSLFHIFYNFNGHSMGAHPKPSSHHSLQVRGAPLLAMVSALGLAVEALERAKAKREAALLISWMLFTGQMAERVENELVI